MKRSGLPAKSSRTFSKRMVCINSALAWAVLVYSIYSQQAAAVAVSAFGFIATLGATYMGVGHMDLRQLLFLLAPTGGYGMPVDPPLGAEPHEPPKDFAG
ncbi:hypothetical protein [Mesorhizobium cantuariense]|uniref:Uncharacterized protein n=1 Tax=Mesorhizobium cantuariense TaxID=1300275 RepID=A0ABV7MYP5_9HYPH